MAYLSLIKKRKVDDVVNASILCIDVPKIPFVYVYN